MRIPSRVTLLTLPLLLGLSAAALADDLQQDAFSGASRNEPPTIYLGTVAVGGKREIFEALQSIKVALDQPISDDPKLADVVVCRLADDIGTHAKQLLVCATNKVLNENRELLQTAMSTAINSDPPKGGDGHGGSSSACMGACFEHAVNILNESLNNQRRHYIKQQVNGASLHALLSSIPYPQDLQPVPAATTSPAPAAVTSHV